MDTLWNRREKTLHPTSYSVPETWPRENQGTYSYGWWHCEQNWDKDWSFNCWTCEVSKSIAKTEEECDIKDVEKYCVWKMSSECHIFDDLQYSDFKRSVSLSNLPPTFYSVRGHIKRAVYLIRRCVNVLAHAHVKNAPCEFGLDVGWGAKTYKISKASTHRTYTYTYMYLQNLCYKKMSLSICSSQMFNILQMYHEQLPKQKKWTMKMCLKQEW